MRVRVMSDVDPGLPALDAMFSKMLVDERWSIRDGRRFTWWSSRYCQEIVACDATVSYGVSVSRLIARTPIATGVPLDERSYAALSGMNADIGTLSALVLGNDGVVSLVATTVVHEAIASWLTNYFAFVAAIQVAEAERFGPAIAAFLQGQVARSAHPQSGPRSDADDLTTIVERLVAPQGEGPSRWSGAPMTEALDIFHSTSLLAVGDDTGASAEFPYREFSSLLQFETRRPHAYVGSGLSATLKLWSPPFDRSPAESAALLNLMEAKGLSLTSQLHGAWCVAPDGKTVAFNAFFPNAFHRQGMATNFALWMSGKAHWVASLNDPRSDDERRREGRPAIAHIIDWDDLDLDDD